MAPCRDAWRRRRAPGGRVATAGADGRCKPRWRCAGGCKRGDGGGDGACGRETKRGQSVAVPMRRQVAPLASHAWGGVRELLQVSFVTTRGFSVVCVHVTQPGEYDQVSARVRSHELGLPCSWSRSCTCQLLLQNQSSSHNGTAFFLDGLHYARDAPFTPVCTVGRVSTGGRRAGEGGAVSHRSAVMGYAGQVLK